MHVSMVLYFPEALSFACGLYVLPSHVYGVKEKKHKERERDRVCVCVCLILDEHPQTRHAYLVLVYKITAGQPTSTARDTQVCIMFINLLDNLWKQSRRKCENGIEKS